MPGADLSASRRARLGAALLVVALHALLLVALLRGFAPDLAVRAARATLSAVTVTVTRSPPPSPEPRPAPAPARPEPAGAAAATGPRARPAPVAARVPPVALASPRPAPPVAGSGAAQTAGAGDAGAGTGAGGAGAGTGNGASGSGTGGGGGESRAVKIAGEISSARDYPAASRAQRLGDYVILALTVGVDGRVTACRVHRPSRDPEADRVTCRLASERFRFRPATDSAGRPVESQFGWQQRWFDPRAGGAGDD